MRLYLVRHGDAVSSQEDPQRPLSSQGRLEIERIAEHLKVRDTRAHFFYHSSKLRARQTAEIIRSTLNKEAPIREAQGLCPEDTPNVFLQEIKSMTEDSVVVSHLPYLPILLSRLVANDFRGGEGGFKTGTTMCLEQSGGKWKIIWKADPELL